MDPIPENALLEQHAGRLYAVFERKARAFRVILYSLVGAAVAFFTVAAYPYIALEDEGLRIETRLEQIADATQSTDALDAGYTAAEEALAQAGSQVDKLYRSFVASDGYYKLLREAKAHERLITALRARINRLPAGVRAWFEDGADPPRYLELLLAEQGVKGDKGWTRDPCARLTAAAWVGCKVAAGVERHHAGAMTALRSAAASGHEIEAALSPDELDEFPAARLAAVRVPFAPYHAGNSLETTGALRRETLKLVKAYRDELTRRQDHVAAARDELQERRGELEREATERRRRRAEVDAQLVRIRQLDRVQTPIGLLPVGLTQLVFAFPVLVALGFGVGAATHRDCARLRRAFQQACRREDPTARLFPDEQVALVAPLWLDPLDPLPTRLARAAVLAVPLVVFGVTVALMVHHGLLQRLPRELAFGRPAVVVAYALSGAALVQAYVAFGRDLLERRRRPAPAEAGDQKASAPVGPRGSTNRGAASDALRRAWPSS